LALLQTAADPAGITKHMWELACCDADTSVYQ